MLDVGTLQFEFPAILPEVERIVLVIRARRHIHIGGDTEGVAGFVEPPFHRRGEDQVAYAASTAQCRGVTCAGDVAERQKKLRVDGDRVAECIHMEQTQDADVGGHPEVRAGLVAVGVSRVRSGVLVINRPDSGADRILLVVARRDFTRVRVEGGQQGGEGQQADLIHRLFLAQGTGPPVKGGKAVEAGG